MIFKPVSSLATKTEKSFFAEKADILINLAQIISTRNFVSLNDISASGDEITKELIDIGVIASDEDLNVLRSALGIETYDKLFKAVGFTIMHKDIAGDFFDKLNNKKRKTIQKVRKANNSLTMVDFFCGAGGLSLGFSQEGFLVKLANDNEEVCAETYMYNHPELPSEKFIRGDIRQITDDIDKYLDTDIDVVAGGPPCQGFSSANQQRIIDDPRNELYKYFIKAVQKIAPKFVVMENVRGMMPYSSQIIEDYNNIRVNIGGSEYGYIVECRILNAEDFSVAQKRERLIFIAIREDVAKHNNITPATIFADIEKGNVGKPRYVLNDALTYIKPLEANRIRNTNEVDSDICGKKTDVNTFKALSGHRGDQQR